MIQYYLNGVSHIKRMHVKKGSKEFIIYMYSTLATSAALQYLSLFFFLQCFMLSTCFSSMDTLLTPSHQSLPGIC